MAIQFFHRPNFKMPTDPHLLPTQKYISHTFEAQP